MHWWNSLFGEVAVITAFIGICAFVAWCIEQASINSHQWNEQGKTPQHESKPSDVASEVHCETTVFEEHPERSHPPDTRAEYQETRTYAYALLTSQYLVVAVAAVGIIVAICTIRSLNQSVDVANRQWQVMLESNKAVLAVERTIPDLDQGDVNIRIDNIGRTPSPYVHLTSYEVRLHPPDNNVIECQRSNYTRYNMPMGPDILDLTIPMRNWSPLDKSKMMTLENNGHVGEMLIYAVTLDYGNGLGDKPETSRYCMQSRYHLTLKQLLWGDCPDAVFTELARITCYEEH
jgi:hypothetical protein